MNQNISKISCLGICLGLQAIAEVFDSKLLKINNVLHGVVSKIEFFDSQDILFKGISHPIEVGHYHSWVVDPENIGDQLRITSKSDGLIMSISHKRFDVKGIQFHPESIMTPRGEKMIENWLYS